METIRSNQKEVFELLIDYEYWAYTSYISLAFNFDRPEFLMTMASKKNQLMNRSKHHMFCKACTTGYTELVNFLLTNYDISDETIKNDVFVVLYLLPKEIDYEKVHQVIAEHQFALDGPIYNQNIIE